MQKTKFHSYTNGKLPRGCELCVKGRKTVIFVTGVCTKSCYFCPLSEQKFHKDVIYANEMPIKDIKDIVKEAKLCSSTGAGLTGGDPLTKLDRTIKIIKLLKKEFGDHFHIHLYTPLDLVEEKTIKQLEKAGLDEIRFHPDLDDDKLWDRINIKTTMSKGIEIPCIPGKDIDKLIKSIEVDFINLNELEYADAKHNKLAELGFETKNEYSYGIKGSEELALALLEAFPDKQIHYCTTKLKDSVQMMNRIKFRAKNVKQSYDIVTGQGTLIRGAIYGDVRDLKLPFQTEYDPVKERLLCSRLNIKKHAKDLRKKGLTPVLVEELATYDEFEIESEEL
tara:strand:- start:2848 stop:3855 length:1008 start_codon:yes stop_codon:yes gene_type:complete